ncbi:polysaccharide deacetylase family protein [Bacillus sp. FJAT-50079]|uniref:polysaccharide deacetylase family protein n=1 Tax=Bacillus sp. FJAT-50079 TaxID=2833577 RepID=UPI001BCA3B68|nr:polysaccharide deacetylase family protein [Bacillus sp. FJAT-50079]MBS4207575.1 polysaccharide deacetylase family protein [Bacillus sp. FJAT-50079]
MNHTKNLIGITLVVILSLLAVFNPYTDKYMLGLKNNAMNVNNKPNELLNKIEQAAEKYNIPPEDAKIDRVWYAMPGYNGLQVDVEASYKMMKKDQQYDERKLVFIQIPPAVHLRELPPAPIFRGHQEKPMVSFLINVAWGNEYIPDMLATLKKHSVQATFFLEGRWVKNNPDLAKMIAEHGHEIGNHSYSHPKMEQLGEAQVREELIKTNEVIEAVTGKKVEWFGPPSGGYNNKTVEIAHSLQMRTIMWTVDTIDWQKPAPHVLIQRVMSKIHSGAMILMHPTEPTSKALDELIVSLKAKQLRIGSVSKLLDEERVMKRQDEPHSY